MCAAIQETIWPHPAASGCVDPLAWGLAFIHRSQVARVCTGLPHIMAPDMCAVVTWAAIHPTMSAHQLDDGSAAPV